MAHNSRSLLFVLLGAGFGAANQTALLTLAGLAPISGVDGLVVDLG